jgi:hypothetical protein
MPASPSSMGKVICRSTSCAAKPGASALMTTCLLVMSGTASMGNCSDW